MIKLLESERILLRALEPTDVDYMLQWENDTTLWQVGNTVAPFSRYQMWEYLKNYTGDIFTSKQVRLVVVDKSSGDTVGAVDLYDFDFFNSRAGIGIVIDAGHRRCRLGIEALTLSLDYAKKFLGIHQCYAVIPVDNVASVALFTAAGFIESGRYRDWLRRGTEWSDAVIMQHI